MFANSMLNILLRLLGQTLKHIRLLGRAVNVEKNG